MPVSPRKLIRSSAERLGYDVYRHEPHHHYVPDFYGPSSKKRLDITTVEPFATLAGKVIADGNTLLYYDRLYTIYQGIERLSGRTGAQPLSVAEVGVFRGGTTYFMASVLRELGVDDAKVHAFDTFAGHDDRDLDVATDPTHTRTRGADFHNTAAREVADYLRPFPNATVHEGRFQDTCGAVADERFGFVHLDVDIHAPTLFGLQFFDQRMPPGGVIVVDDYAVKSCPGIQQAVADFLAEHGARYVMFHLLSAQALFVKVE